MMLCLDTYALVAFHDRNPEYLSLLNKEWVTTDLAVAEFYNLLYRRHDEKTAIFWCCKFSQYAKQTSLSVLLKAMKFKVDNTKKNYSFFDCVGYVYARENKIQFVTGDKEFKNMPGVLFLV